MAYWQVTLDLRSALATPLHSGTIFGHLCWAWRDLHSEESLVQWIRSLPGAPVLLSDAFPVGFFPKPILPPTVQLPDPSIAKALKKQRYLPIELFLSQRHAMSEFVVAQQATERSDASKLTFEHRVPHNRIDRHTGTTPESGGLYFMDEYWPNGPKRHDIRAEIATDAWDVYVSADLTESELSALFRHVGSNGFGKDASLGRGRFVARVQPAPDALFQQIGNRRMSLSHGSLTANMRDARYKLHTHYGKLGPTLANNRSPFKYPLTLLQPGATFVADNDGPFGELLGDLHPDADLKHVVHNAWHLTIPYTEPTHADA